VFTLKILITSAGTRFSRELADSLSASHEVRKTDRNEFSVSHEFVRSKLDHSQNTNDLVRGMDVIIHSGASDPQASPSDQLDYQMRCTYNLLRVAVDEGVPRFIYLSSLELMALYDEAMAVTERWETRPTTDPPLLSTHLGEVICREFAREGKINVVLLRLGRITAADEANPSTSALYMDDATNAISKALSANLSGWFDIFHIQSAVANARYLTGQPWWSADEVSPPIDLGYAPQVRDEDRTRA
jgi:nucleoside-diphosphate-sugar epimerase